MEKLTTTEIKTINIIYKKIFGYEVNYIYFYKITYVDNFFINIYDT